MSLLEQNTTRKRQVDKNVTEFEDGNNEEYEMEGIWDSAVYAKESEVSHLPGLYYLIPWKSYPKKENTKEPALVVQHLWKLLSAFHKDNSNKPTATSLLVDTTPLMAWPCSKPPKAAKQKHSRLATSSRNWKTKIL